MSTLVLPMSSPKSLKRTFDDVEDIENRQPNATDIPPQSPLSNVHSAQPLPEMNIAPSNVPPNPPKKPKLTFAEREAEKEAKKIEKEAKEREKAEERAKKEEEKQRKEQEKAAREAEREKKALEKKAKDEELRKAREEREKVKEEQKAKREEEKTKRDEEKAKKEEEKHKKDRSQLRLNAFFGQPITRSPTNSPVATPSASRRGSVAAEERTPLKREKSATPTPQNSRYSDFERQFPSFFVHPNVVLAPNNRFRQEDASNAAREKFDHELLDHGKHKQDPRPFSKFKKHRTSRGVSVKSIIAQIDKDARLVDLTGPQRPLQPADQLKNVPRKYIKFYEDVRPPYVGTFTRVSSPSTIAKLSRNPFSRGMPNTNYDYDSEAEWEDPGEGEDLVSEDEEPDADEDEDEMDGFLDDEDAADAKPKRRALLGDLEPSSTGICWSENEGPDLSSYAIDMLKEVPTFPIDPYSTDYWAQPPTKPDIQRLQPPSLDANPPLKPTKPQNPLPAPNQNNPSSQIFPLSLNPTAKRKPPVQPNVTGPSAPKKLIPMDMLEEFKQEILQGSNLSKVGLVEVLKTKFPKCSKEVLKDSVDVVAVRQGTKLADKRWVIREEYSGVK